MKCKVIDAANHMVRTLKLLNGGALCIRIDRDEIANVSITNPHIETSRAVTRTRTWYRRWFAAAGSGHDHDVGLLSLVA